MYHVLVFFLVTVCFFYVPGTWILSKFRLKMLTPEPFIIPTALGMMVFTLATYITSWFQVSQLIFLPIAVILFAQRKMLVPKFILEKKHIMPFIVVALLSLVFSLPRILGGIWGNTFSYGGDDVLHLSYMHELRAHFPPDNPGFAGTPLVGYHFFSDFFIAKINELSGIPIESLYYHFVPLLVVLAIGYGIYSLVFTWTKRRSAGLWAVFLAMFGGSFGFIIRLQGHTNASLASVFGIDQPASAMLNSPFAFSLLLMTAALLFVYHYSQTKKIGWLWLMALVVGLSPLFKIYAGIVLFSGLSVLVAIELLRKNFRVIPPYVTAIGIALATYGVFSGSGNYITFFPLWPPHRMLQANFPWYGYDEKMYTFTRLGVIRGIIDVEIHGLLLFLFGNLGTRLIGILIAGALWLRHRKFPSLFTLTILGMMTTSILIPLFFIQSVKVFEMIQMTWYYPFFAAICAAYGLASIGKRWLIIGALILATIPSTYEIYSTYVFRPRPRQPMEAFASLQYLRSHGTYDDTVLELPPSSVENTLPKLIAWYEGSSSKFAAFGNKRSYFNTLEIDFPNLDIGGRAQFLLEVRALLAESKVDKKTLRKKLSDRGIKYMYSQDPIPFPSPAKCIYTVD